jgi:hypothetical protein
LISAISAVGTRSIGAQWRAAFGPTPRPPEHPDAAGDGERGAERAHAAWGFLLYYDEDVHHTSIFILTLFADGRPAKRCEVMTFSHIDAQHPVCPVHPLLLPGAPGLTLIHVNPAPSRTRDKVSRMHRTPFQAFDSFRCRSQSAIAADPRRGASNMSLWTIILIILVIALLGGFSGIGGGPFYGTGYYGGGGLGLVIVVLLILLLLGKL